MPILLFRLNHVPADEADEVRALLREHGIDFYETDAGRWGISVAAIWLRDDAQLAQAQQLLGEYQRTRAASAREAYARQRAAGEHETVLERFLRHPLRFLFIVGVIALIAYFTVTLFFHIL